MTAGSRPPGPAGGDDAGDSLTSADFVSLADDGGSFLRAVAATSIRAGHVAQLELASIGGHRILERIGAGGMGIVYRAVDPDGREVALKVLRRREGDSASARRRFVREAEVALRIVDPHVVRVLRVGQDGDDTFITMELLVGESLRTRLDRARPSLHEAVGFALDVARGVGAAHRAGAIHRDLKPENVWVEPGGRAKVLDFGLARWMDDGVEGRSLLTAQGGILGTVGYMSPEQGRGQPVDAQSDLFSLGVVLYELLAGRRPFTGASPTDVFLASACDPPPELAPLCPGLPPRLEALVVSLLEKSRTARPASADHVERELAFVRDALDEPSRTSS